jgi:hypothetical protein
MKITTLITVAIALGTSACAGLDGFEIRNKGMGTTYTNAVNRAGMKLAEKCEGGVEYDYRLYRHESKPKVETPEYRHLYPGNDTETTSRFHVGCATLPTDLPNDDKRRRRPL